MTFNKSARAILEELTGSYAASDDLPDSNYRGQERLHQLLLTKLPTALKSLTELHEAEIAKYQEIFSWLLGESGVFPTSQQGARYNWRPELRKRLANLKGDK